MITCWELDLPGILRDLRLQDSGPAFAGLFTRICCQDLQAQAQDRKRKTERDPDETKTMSPRKMATGLGRSIRIHFSPVLERFAPAPERSLCPRA